MSAIDDIYHNFWGKQKPKFSEMEIALMEGGHSLHKDEKFSFLKSIDHRNATDFVKRFPKNQWVADISTADKHEVSGDLVSLVQAAYGDTPHGSFVNSIKDVIPSDWNVIDFDHDPDIDACVFYRKPRHGERWRGHKIQGIGHDGTRASKDHAISKVHSLLLTPGWWIESSDAMRATLMKVNLHPISDVRLLKQLFNDPNITMIDRYTYTRQLSNGTVVTETVFGDPIINAEVREANEWETIP